MKDYKLKILDSFISLSKSKSIYDINSSDIIKASSVSKAGFYSNFDNCSDVFNYLNQFLKQRYDKTIISKIDGLPEGLLTAKKLIMIVIEFVIDPLYTDKEFIINLMKAKFSYLVYDYITISLLNYISKSYGYHSRAYLDGLLVIRNCFATFEIMVSDLPNLKKTEFKDKLYDLTNDSLENIVNSI